MKVLKFGGTSVGSVEAIKSLARIVMDRRNPVVVVSAFSRVTDTLILLAERACADDPEADSIMVTLRKRHFEAVEALLPGAGGEETARAVRELLEELAVIVSGIRCLRELSPRSRDLVMSFGERISSVIVAAALSSMGVRARAVDAREFIVATDDHGDARPLRERTDPKVRAALGGILDHVPVVTGFIASTESGSTVTLGRGGSDFTAAILGAALHAEEVEIWTDVDGIMTADPRKVPDAFSLDSLMYDEAMELSHFGAKVIYPPTVQPALSEGIPIRILNTFNPSFPGTVIRSDAPPSEYPVRGIASINDAALITLQGPGMIGVSGIAMRLFGCLAKRKISVILISQASSEHSICFSIAPRDRAAAVAAMNGEFGRELEDGRIEPPVAEGGKSILAIVGEGMRHSPGVAGKFFSALGKNAVNIAAIAQGSSELNISAVVDAADETRALRAVHEAFFRPGLKTVDVFLSGRGLVGGELLEQMRRQQKALLESRSIRLRVLGIANSGKILLDREGIDLESWKARFDQEAIVSQARGSDSGNTLDALMDGIDASHSPNAVFVDCTASDEPPKRYLRAFRSNVAVVTSNKRGNTGSMASWREIRDTSLETGTPYLYETTAGAGLPIVSTIRDLVSAGDRIVRIEAVLSGTLAFLFSNYDGEASFASLVRGAMAAGYAEPDPREDLGALDCARKALILAREAGFEIEPEDMEVESLIPPPCSGEKGVEDFLLSLEREDKYFRDRFDGAKARGKRLAYAASIDAGAGSAGGRVRARVGLREAGPEEPLFKLRGPENLVAFTTERYDPIPIVVRGPGAGAAVTAGGLFADVIRLAARTW